MAPGDLRALLRDTLQLWDESGRVSVEDGHIAITRDAGTFRITSGPAPTRWFLQTPAREAAGRPPRPAPSITALLTALRVALVVPQGSTARIGKGATPGPDACTPPRPPL